MVVHKHSVDTLWNEESSSISLPGHIRQDEDVKTYQDGISRYTYIFIKATIITLDYQTLQLQLWISIFCIEV